MKPYKTQAEVGDFQGKPVLSIWQVNERGEKVKQFPVIAFGRGKAIAIVEHFDMIKAFTENQKQDETE